VVQQTVGYSGYHGVEFAQVEGESEHGPKTGAQGDVCTSDGEAGSVRGEKRPLRNADPAEPALKRQQTGAVSPRRWSLHCVAHPVLCCSVLLTGGPSDSAAMLAGRPVKQEDEHAAGGNGAVGGRELRALMRSQGGTGSDSAQPEGNSASARGAHVRYVSCFASSQVPILCLMVEARMQVG
jgi:hypothetical protein